jgi:pimeloyl-ACP methyl ester carboxylesterase
VRKIEIVRATDPVRPSRGRTSRWLLTVALTIAGVLTLALLAGASYQLIGLRIDARRFPQVGKSVDIGGYKININCSGQGSPTVILEAGGGGFSTDWRLVQPEIAKFAHVCSYDRAGFGWSDAGPMPRTSAQIVKELHSLLQRSGEKPPYVLVGQSAGGLHVRIFNGRYPNEVAGMVLVDASHEDYMREMPIDVQKYQKNADRQFLREQKLRLFLVWFGITRLMLPRSASWSERLALQPKFVNALSSEYANNFEESARQVRAAGTLGDKPLIVLTAGRDTADPEHLPPGITKKDLQDYDHVWIDDLQVREAHLSSRGRQIIVSDSRHNIQFDRPDAVVSAVQEVFAEVKDQ